MASFSSSAASTVDVQSRVPRVQLGLSRVGVTDVEKVIRMRQDGSEQLVSARFECVIELAPEGFDADSIERIFEAVPVATHNQRGLGTLLIGCTEMCDDDIDAATLLAIVEHAMSSEIYELMKRSDEARVVEKAHRRPRFVEDCVREMIRGVLEAFT